MVDDRNAKGIVARSTLPEKKPARNSRGQPTIVERMESLTQSKLKMVGALADDTNLHKTKALRHCNVRLSKEMNERERKRAIMRTRVKREKKTHKTNENDISTKAQQSKQYA